MSDYLMHFRTKGSKNGERRYQNEDGTWTNLGKERRRLEYNKIDKEKLKSTAKKAGALALVGATVAGSTAAAVAVGTNANTANKAFTKGKDDKPSAAEKITRSSKDGIEASQKIYRSIAKEDKKKEDLSKYSDDELRKRIARMDLERRYDELNSRNVSEGKDYVDTALNIAGGIAAIAGSAAAIATAIYTIKSKAS